MQICRVGVERGREPGLSQGPGMQPQMKPLEKNVFIFMDTGSVQRLIEGTRDSKASCRKCLRPGWKSKALGAQAPPASRPHPMHPVGDLGKGPLPG